MTTLTTEELLKRATPRPWQVAISTQTRKTYVLGPGAIAMADVITMPTLCREHEFNAELIRRMAASWEAMREFAALFDAYDKENCQSGKITWEELRLSCHRALALSNGEEPAQ